MYRSFVFIQSEFLLGVSVSLVPAWGDLFVNYVWTMWTWFITIIAYKGFWNLYVGYKYAWSNTQCGSYSHYIWFMFTNQVVYKLALLLPMGPQTVVNPYIYSNYQILSNTYGGSYSHYLHVYYNIYRCVCVCSIELYQHDSIADYAWEVILGFEAPLIVLHTHAIYHETKNYGSW